MPDAMKEQVGLAIEKPDKPINAESARYSRKVERRHAVSKITTGQLLEHPELQEKDIWELGYVSTSDSDDNDEESSEEYDSEEEGGESEQEEDSHETREHSIAAEESKQARPVSQAESAPSNAST